MNSHKKHNMPLGEDTAFILMKCMPPPPFRESLHSIWNNGQWGVCPAFQSMTQTKWTMWASCSSTDKINEVYSIGLHFCEQMEESRAVPMRRTNCRLGQSLWKPACCCITEHIHMQMLQAHEDSYQFLIPISDYQTQIWTEINYLQFYFPSNSAFHLVVYKTMSEKMCSVSGRQTHHGSSCLCGGFKGELKGLNGLIERDKNRTK